MEKYKFYCKNCGALLRYSGKDYGKNVRFFTCVNEDLGCGTSIWIDIETRKDNQGRKY